MSPAGLSLDAGALIAFERGNEHVRMLLRRAHTYGVPIHCVPEVVAQVWRDGSRQAELARLLKHKSMRFPVLDVETARAVGEICGRSGHADVVDVHVVVEAKLSGHPVITSDAGDLRRIDSSLPLIEI